MSNIYKILSLIAVVFLLTLTAAAQGTNYYVSTTGDDSNSGTSPDSAWATIDHGDEIGLIEDGDTVNILSGTYLLTETVHLTETGSEPWPIVYRRLGRGPAILDGQNIVAECIWIQGNYTNVYGLEVTNATENCVRAENRNSVLAECYVHDATNNGILINDGNLLVLRNVCVDNGAAGIRIDGGGDDSRIYGNTVCYNEGMGVQVTANAWSVRIFNNIVCENGTVGIHGEWLTVCGFNNVWENLTTGYESVEDSAGGIRVEPQFVSDLMGRYDLRYTAAEIDAGWRPTGPESVFVYTYNGLAPEIGAFEKYNVYYVSEIGDDLADGLTQATAWQSIDNGDSLLLPGDTVHVLPGIYTDSVIISDGGEEDDLISFVGVRDSCLVDASGTSIGVDIISSHLRWSGIDVQGADSINVKVVGLHNIVEDCHFGESTVGILANIGASTLRNNVFHDNSYAGIHMTAGNTPVFVNNTFFNNDYRDVVVGAVSALTIINNIFFTYDTGDTAIEHSEWTGITHCLFFGYDEPVAVGGTPGEGCLVDVDPLMIDPDNGNFHLQQESPAIDAGKVYEYPFNGYAPDLGAYETGIPAVIEVVDGPATLLADSTHRFTVNAFDADGYPASPEPLSWSHTFSSGSISSSGLFTPNLECDGEIIAQNVVYNLEDTSATMTVVPGTLDEMTVGPLSDTLQVDSTSQFSVSGWDVWGNPVVDFGNITWDVLNGIGTIDQTGLFTAQYAGYGFVRASSDLGPSCYTDTIAVTSGAIEVNVTALSIPPKELIPGMTTGPVLAMNFSNSHFSPVSLDSVRVSFAGYDPDGATQSDLDSQVESVALYLDLDNKYTSLSPDDSLLAQGTLDNGQLVFHTDGLAINPNGGSIRLTVAADLDIDNAKNANRISFELTEGADVYLDGVIPVTGSFPIQNEVDYAINGFPAATVTVNPVEPFTLIYGQSNKLVLDLDLPTNGYAEDFLGSMKLINSGTFEENDDIISVALWGDVTGDGFTGDDVMLGNFDYLSGFWEISNLSYGLDDTPNRVMVLVNVIGNQFEGGSLSFEIPPKGIEYLSGADGPDDASLSNPNSFVVMPADRVTAVSIPSSSTPVIPGSSGNRVLTFALYNGYGTAKTLRSVRFTNHSITQSTADFADGELGQVSLHFDEDYDRQMDNDPVIASGYFNDGALQLTMAGLVLPSEALCYFFVTVDLPLNMIDSDSLTLDIDHESDFVFELDEGQAVNINGDMPLTSGGYLIVDGSIRSQYEVLPVTSGSVIPGDTSITLFAFRPAASGDQVDYLTSLTMNNVGTAGPSDFEAFELWLDDNGDDLWQPDDSLVASFAYASGGWTAMPSGLEVTAGSPAMFVLADVAGAASPGVSFQAEVPVGGSQYASSNDGPLDLPLTSGGEHVISSSGMRMGLLPLEPSYSVGQEITVTANVKNLLGSPLNEVYCEFVSVTDGSDSIVLGPVSLASQGSTEFVGSFTASQVGSESWRVRAFSNTPVDSSVTVHTDQADIFEVPSDVDVELLNSIPTAVSRGQANVFPLSIRFQQVDSSETMSSLRLDSLRIGVEDSDGQPLAANSVFSRMVLATNNTNLVVNSAIGALSTVTLNFSEPVIVPAGEEQLLSLLVDIDSAAIASSFALTLPDASSINVVDKNTLVSVEFDAEVAFPMQTASCRIEDPSQRLATSGTSVLNPYVNYGQESVSGLEIVVRHPGESSESQIQITSLSLEFIDETLTPITASELISGLRVLKQQMIVGELTEFELEDDSLTVDFGAPPTLNPGETESLYIQFDIKPQSIHEAFAVLVADSTAFTVRDISSGSIIAAVSDLELATGNVFPILSGFAQLRTPAAAPRVCLTSSMPECIIGGTEGVELLEVLATYPVSDDHSPVRVKDITVRVNDSAGVPLNPNELFDQIGASISDATIIYEPYIELQDGAVVFHLNDGGVLVNPGDTTAVRLYADIESATPVEHFYVKVQSDDALIIADATDTTSNPGIIVSASCASTFPFSSEVTEVYLRAGRPTISINTPSTQLVYPGQTSLQLLELTVLYDSPSLQGDLLLNGFVGQTLQRTVSGLQSLPGNSVFENFAVRTDSDTLSMDSALAGDSVILSINDGLTIRRNTSHTLTLVCDICSDAPLGNYLVRLPDSAFCDLLDKNLMTAIYPILNGADYPLLSAELSLTHANLKNSFTNYPNPFNPDNGEEAIIGFVLAEDAHINIDLFTVTGDLVARLATDEFRTAGPHQEDTWDGQNDSGMRVLPGTYFCCLRADYVSGRTETFKRKITVIW